MKTGSTQSLQTISFGVTVAAGPLCVPPHEMFDKVLGKNMKYLSALILSVFFTYSPLITASPDVAAFDNSEIALPQLTIGKKPGTPEEELRRKKLTDIPDNWVSAYRNSFTYWSNHKDIAGLPAALNALDKELNDLSTRKADSDRDIAHAAKALRALATYCVRISKSNPEEAKRLIQYINEKLKPLKAEFQPQQKYRKVYLNISFLAGAPDASSGVNLDSLYDPIQKSSYESAFAQNYANEIYNRRQSELRSFFIGLKRIKRFYPELQELEEMGDLLIDERASKITK